MLEVGEKMKSIDLIKSIKTDTIHNYVLPGLSSSLIKFGKVRLFESCRNTEEFITPHSHRFPFACLVLQGSVQNSLWVEDEDGDEYQISELNYKGKVGKYKVIEKDVRRFAAFTEEYRTGHWYVMEANQIHSIRFSKDAIVLFFEGIDESQTTQILQPVVNMNVIPTFKIEDWMFENA
jgi:hypothetical protein